MERTREGRTDRIKWDWLVGRVGLDKGGGRRWHKKKKIQEENQKGERKTYSIKNHVYFEEDDPFGWPCQLLAFQGVGFAFSILDLWERDMTGVCLAIPG